MNTYDSFVKNNLLVLSGNLLVYAQGIILMPLIIKTVGVSIYGGYILITSLAGFTMGISSLGIGFRRSRFLPSVPDPQARQTLFYPQFHFQLASLMVLSCLLIFFYPLFDKLFLKGEVVFSVYLVIPYFVFYFLYSQTTDYFRYTHRMNYFTYGTTIFTFLNIAFIFLFYAFRRYLTVNVLFTIQIVSALLVSLPLTVMVVKEIGFKAALPDLSACIDDIKLGFPLVLSYVVDVILSTSDRYLITAFLSVTAVGYYIPGYSLGTLIILLPKIFGVVLPPLLAKSVDTGSEAEARLMVNYALKGFLLIAIPFIFGCVILGKPLLTLLANAEVARQAYLVAIFVALGTLFYGLELIITNVLFVRLRTTAILKINLGAALLNLSLNVIFLYLFRHILVAAVTTALSYLVIFVVIYKAALTDWPLDFDLKTILKSLAASAVMGGVLYSVSSQVGDHAWRLVPVLAEIGLGVIIYFAALFLLRTFSAKELGYLKKAFSFS